MSRSAKKSGAKPKTTRARTKHTATTIIEKETTTGGREPAETVVDATSDDGVDRSVAITLQPKVAQLTQRVTGPDGKRRTIRLYRGRVYHMPNGVKWEGRDGQGNIGLPSAVIILGASSVEPVKMSDLDLQQTRAHRVGRVMPGLAAAQAYVAKRLGTAEAAAARDLGADALVETYNVIAATDPDQKEMELPDLRPPMPAGVTELTGDVAALIARRFNPPKPVSVAEEIQEAYAVSRGHPFFDADADDAAEDAGSIDAPPDDGEAV